MTMSDKIVAKLGEIFRAHDFGDVIVPVDSRHTEISLLDDAQMSMTWCVYLPLAEWCQESIGYVPPLICLASYDDRCWYAVLKTPEDAFHFRLYISGDLDDG